MTRWLLIRLAWCLVMLFGITFITFAVFDLAPVDRAEIEVMRAAQDGSVADAASRDAAILRLRVHYGMLDATTLEPAPVWRRYLAWLGNAATLQLAGPGADNDVFWRRLWQAVPVTAWLGGLSLLVIFGVALPLGSWLGLRAGSRADRIASTCMLALVGVPEFLLATLLLLTFSVLWVQWLPSSGLRSPGSSTWSAGWQVFDFLRHLLLPVLAMSAAPSVMVARFVRDSVARAAVAPFAVSMRALGVDEGVLRWRLLRHGCTPVATLTGGLLPMLVGGSIVVETMFSLDGLGQMAFQAVMNQDQATVMALVLLTSIVTLLSFLLSDVLLRVVDPRVRLQP
jgi:peptide/nickel transport system permease protein